MWYLPGSVNRLKCHGHLRELVAIGFETEILRVSLSNKSIWLISSANKVIALVVIQMKKEMGNEFPLFPCEAVNESLWHRKVCTRTYSCILYSVVAVQTLVLMYLFTCK